VCRVRHLSDLRHTRKRLASLGIHIITALLCVLDSRSGVFEGATDLCAKNSEFSAVRRTVREI